MKKVFFIIILFAVSIITSCTKAEENIQLISEEQDKITVQEVVEVDVKELTLEEKIQDFEYLYNVILENYPFLEVNKRINGIDWGEKKETYLQRITSSKDDDQFFRALDAILKDLNNGHTHMLNKSMVKYFREAYYVLYQESTFKEYFEILNHDLVLKRYDLENIEVGEVSNLQESIEKISEINNAEVGDIVDGKIGYIYIPSMIQSHQMENDEKLINDYLEKIKDYQSLIIDIRGNGGGSPGYWMDYLVPRIISEAKEFEVYTFFRAGSIFNRLLEIAPLENEIKGLDEVGINKLEKLDLSQLPNLSEEIKDSFAYYVKNKLEVIPHEDSIRFEGNIYLLVDKNTYSAADLFSVFAKDTNFATLVGEKTMGGGISDEPRFEMLPNSGYIFRFPLMMGTTSDGTVSEEQKTTPHYEVNFPRRNTNISYDLAIQKVLQLEGLDNQ